MLGKRMSLFDLKKHFGTTLIIKKILILTALWAAVIIHSSVVLACATCLCGDPTLTTMGMEKNFPGRFRVSVEGLTRSEKVGSSQSNWHDLEEQRWTTSLSYWLNDQLTLSARLPYLNKTIETGNLARYEGWGFGDMELSMRYQLWQDRPLRPTHTFGLLAGLRIPTAEEAYDGNRLLDIDAQPGTGALVPQLGLWHGWYRYPHFLYTSATWHLPNEGFQSFQAGDALTATVKYQYAINHRVALQLGFDSRWATHDHYAGKQDPDSGGFNTFATPGIVVELAEDLLLHFNVQIPWIERLNGAHREEAVLQLGVTYDF